MSTRSLTSDLRALGRRGIEAVKAAPGWLGGILTGLQGALLSYLMVLAPTMAVVAASPHSSLSTGIDWGGAARFSTHLWLFGHGVPIEVDGVAITLIPLGLTLACGAILAAIARRFAARTWGSWALAVATYAVIVGGAATWVSGSAVQGEAVLASVVAAALAAVAVAVGVWRAHGLDLAWLMRVPEFARVAIRRCAAALTLVVCAAAVAQTAWAVVGRERIAEGATVLGLDGVGGAVLAVAELAYVPTMVLWMVAWLSGQGFSVGLGSIYAPGSLTAEPLPVLPILGALPSSSCGWLVWVPATVVVAVAVVRVVTVRRSLTWRLEAAADGAALVGLGVAVAALCGLASGAAGPDRLQSVGADALPVTVAIVALAFVGAAVGTGARWLADRPGLRRLLRQQPLAAPAAAAAAGPHTPTEPDGAENSSAHRPVDATAGR